jgi:hypothetical protein
MHAKTVAKIKEHMHKLHNTNAVLLFKVIKHEIKFKSIPISYCSCRECRGTERSLSHSKIIWNPNVAMQHISKLADDRAKLAKLAPIKYKLIKHSERFFDYFITTTWQQIN